MKNLILLFTGIFLITISLNGQENTKLRGKILFLNSKKKPAIGVEISGSVKNEKANSTYSIDDGSYQLKFPNARIGFPVKLIIGNTDKNNTRIELVNDKELELCKIPAQIADEFEIIVCRKGERDIIAQRYYKIIKTSSDIALAKKEKEYNELLASKEKDYVKIARMSSELARLEKLTDSLTISKEAFNIASINKDNASKRVLRYIQLLDEGKTIQEAREALSIKKAALDLTQGMKLFKASIKELGTRAAASNAIFDYEDATICFDTIITYSLELNLNRQNIARWYIKAATALSGSGKNKRSIEYFQQAINIQEEILDSLHPDLALSYSTIGYNYLYLGSYKKSLEFQLKAINIQEEILDSLHPDLATSYNRIGIAYNYLRQHEKALEYQQKSIGIRNEILESNDINIANSYASLGETYNYLRKYEKALKYQIKALSIRKEVLDPQHPNISKSYSNISGTYNNLRQHEKALEYQKKDIKIKEDNLNPKHPRLVNSYYNMGSTYMYLKDYEKALELQQKSLEIGEEILDPQHPNFIVFYSNISGTYQYLGQFEKALEYQQKAIAIGEEILDTKHPTLAMIYSNVGNTYSYLKQYDKALEYQQKAIIIREEILDHQHPSLAITYDNTGSTYRYLKNYKKALEYHKKAFNIRKEVLDSQHPEIATSYYNIAVTHCKNNQFKKGYNTLTKFDEEIGSEVMSSRNWVMYYAIKGDEIEAMRYLKKAIELDFKDLVWLKTADSINSLRNNQDFIKIIEKMENELTK